MANIWCSIKQILMCSEVILLTLKSSWLIFLVIYCVIIFCAKELYRNLFPVSVRLRERRLRFSGHCWRSKSETISQLFMWEHLRGTWLSVAVVTQKHICTAGQICFPFKNTVLRRKCQIIRLFEIMNISAI